MINKSASNTQKRGQQEMVGFVLIVVLVVVGLMVFLVLSLRTSDENIGSPEVYNMLDAIMGHTTDCAIPSLPYYDDFEDLFKSCYKGDHCNNLGVEACEYLDEELANILEGMFATESNIITYYDVTMFEKDEADIQVELMNVSEGECVGDRNAAQRNIELRNSDNTLVVRMTVCNSLND